MRTIKNKNASRQEEDSNYLQKDADKDFKRQKKEQSTHRSQRGKGAEGRSELQKDFQDQQQQVLGQSKSTRQKSKGEEGEKEEGQEPSTARQARHYQRRYV